MFTRHVKISCGLTLTALLLTPCVVSAQNIIKAGEKTAVAVEKTVKAAQESAAAAATKAAGTVTVRVKAEVPAGAATSPVVTSSKFPTTSEVKSSVPQSAAQGLTKTELKTPSALAQSAEVPTSAEVFMPTVSQEDALFQAIGAKVSNMATTEEVIEFKQELPTTAQLQEIASKLNPEHINLLDIPTVIKTADPEFDELANNIIYSMAAAPEKRMRLTRQEMDKVLKYPQLTECTLDADIMWVYDEEEAYVNQNITELMERAVRLGYGDTVTLLIKRGAKVNVGGSMGLDRDSVLMIAVRRGDVDMAKKLMDAGASPLFVVTTPDFRMGKTTEYETILSVAVARQDMPMVKALEIRDVPLYYSDRAFEVSVTLEDPTMLKEMIAYRGGGVQDIEYGGGSLRKYKFWYSLETPVKNGWVEHVNILLENGAKPYPALLDMAKNKPGDNYKQIADMLEKALAK